MELFKSLASLLAYLALGFSVTAAYLKVNKIWTRKHHVEVANSISVAGNFLAIIPWALFGLNFLLVAQWQGFINSVIWITTFSVLLLIGTGLWVESKRNLGFWARVKIALKLERSEVGDLALSLFRPSNADIVLEILTQFAYIDRNLAAREKAFIQSFADNCKLEIDWEAFEEFADEENAVRFVKARESVLRYLRTSPPNDQVTQLLDLLEALVRVDQKFSTQERLILGEVRQLLRGYTDKKDAKANCTVVVVPQSNDQDVAIAALLTHSEKTELAGGAGYKIGTYFSRNYAEMICQQYRTLGFFTINMIRESSEPSGSEPESLLAVF